MKTQLMTVLFILTTGAGLFAVPAALPQITELKGLHSKALVFDEATTTKPIILKSVEDAAKYLKKDAQAAISKDVDFEKQVVLVFAWKGSGQDRFSYAVTKDHPGQIKFTYQRGMTRDLRPHVKIYAVKSGVKWSTK